MSAVKNRLLSERAQHLFKVLVETYISDGHPVGSRTLARGAGLDLSPATIRNVMADLEDLGLIRSPHTSAGRIPTALGYRFFVDSLLTVKSISELEVQRVSADLGSETDIPGILGRTSRLLSESTQLAGVVMVPRSTSRALRHVEFLQLTDDRVLAVMVFSNKDIQNRVIVTDRKYSSAELQQASNYLNQAFAGHELKAVREKLLAEMSVAREEMNSIMQTAVEFAHKAFDAEPADSDDYVLAGQTNLMGFEELADVNKLKQLFEAFTQKRDILSLLDQALNAQGVQIFIGEESGYRFLNECSVVTSTYQSDGQVLGVLGIIGPTRMEYERVIPVVDLTAKILGLALKSLH
jgi:heat-inducible transcriptional repressor